MGWFPLLLSLRVALLATLLTTVVGVTGAYALARFRFPGRGLVEAVASLPYCLRTATAAISALDAGYEEAARVAGNIPGRTQTMPIAVFDRVQAFDYTTAGVLAGVLSAVAIAVLLGVRRLEPSAL